MPIDKPPCPVLTHGHEPKQDARGQAKVKPQEVLQGPARFAEADQIAQEAEPKLKDSDQQSSEHSAEPVAAKHSFASGSAKYQLVAWRAGYASAAEFNFHNRRGGD